ncbi:hypothetical protein DB347_25295 [Opitutaceae bacterium EW11]|nr:hypothetical protein DB347_25295 [Opitutaceae bacterium EW11]
MSWLVYSVRCLALLDSTAGCLKSFAWDQGRALIEIVTSLIQIIQLSRQGSGVGLKRAIHRAKNSRVVVQGLVSVSCLGVPPVMLARVNECDERRADGDPDRQCAG